MRWCRCLIRILGRRQSAFRLALGLSMLPSVALGAELTLMIEPGIEQRRNYDREDVWTRQCVRILPPENAAYLLTVQVPDDWLANGARSVAQPGVGQLNAEHAEILRAAMDERDLMTEGDPLLLAGHVIALLRPMEIDGTTAPARRVRVWPLWEVLAYSPKADTLSVAVAAVQALEEMGAGARVARYPAEQGHYSFGVLMPAPAGEVRTGSWAYRAGRNMLLPVALSAKPVTDLQPDDLVAWTWQEVLTPGWNPGGVQRGNPPGEAPAADPAQQELEAQPDLCRQAEALNLECVSGDPGEGRQQTLLILSALILVSLITWSISALYRRRLRLLRVWKERDWRRRNKF